MSIFPIYDYAVNLNKVCYSAIKEAVAVFSVIFVRNTSHLRYVAAIARRG